MSLDLKQNLGGKHNWVGLNSRETAKKRKKKIKNVP